MNFDAESHLNAMERFVSLLDRDGRPASAVTLSRSYATAIENLWDAVTNSERILRWFTGISGELELGGRYQLEGNASGVITACEPLTHYALTWEFNGDVSWVTVRLSDGGTGNVRLALTHTALLSDAPWWYPFIHTLLSEAVEKPSHAECAEVTSTLGQCPCKGVTT